MPRQSTVPREEIAALLGAGDLTESAIAEQTGVSRPTVASVRKTLGLPAPGKGKAPEYATVEDAFRAHAVPATGGHTEWTGVRTGANAPMVRYRSDSLSAYRVAFRLHHGRDPEGVVYPTCGQPGCVAGAHLADTPMRQTAARAAKAATRRGPAWVPRAEIVALLQEGHSNRYIGRTLRTNPLRVARIRAELGLPKVELRVLPLEEAWRARTRPVDGGHLQWTGTYREGTPVLTHAGQHYTAYRVAFGFVNDREPVGRIYPGCGVARCVEPTHLEDRTIRQTLSTQFNAIFGSAA
ncbi:hypothetical protein [Streptomyces sp. ZSW22]|uniref:hypothetical protein n=1 Tax=Streptomyces sp. ZSW22 TaxID=3055050 RepID=UPI0025AF5C57|nr:hypothetical protein [Streptomyces sp. ZSW22]MDN3244106.1 hypothetical protein [Streptomyces sp. ZSW22]